MFQDDGPGGQQGARDTQDIATEHVDHVDEFLRIGVVNLASDEHRGEPQQHQRPGRAVGEEQFVAVLAIGREEQLDAENE